MRRIIFSIAIFLFSLASVMGQKIPINLPADGNWPTIVGDSIMIIGPRQNELTEEQRYFNPIYLMVYPGKEHLQAQIIRAGLCDCDLTKPNRRIGVFSVAPDKQVSFSQGNLQYLPAINLWKFANTQYEYLGNANKYLKPTFRNLVDLFGWSANNTTAPFGVSTSMSASDYAGDFVDWGTNTICGDAPNTWRTLSRDEWEYLLNGRENAQQLRTKGSVEGKEGVILLPDNWICPEGYTIAIIPDEANLQSNVNTYSQADWSKLEAAGAIILPSAGMRRNAIEVEVRHPNIFGGYWTCTNKDEHNSYCYTFHTQDCEYVDYSNHIYGRAVRLVHDTIVPETIPEPCLIVKVNDTLSINLMCVEGGTFMMGATPEMDPDALAHEAPVHSVTLSDYYIGQIEVTQALWKTVMGTNPSTIKDNNRPVNNVSWEDCQVFIEKLNQKTGYSFRLPTEAEWEYAARGGNKSRGYKYAGSDNIDEVAWYKDNSGGKYQPSALKKPNELGIYDMSGNVFEWCQDWYGPYSADAQVNPQGPESGPYHMIRGGGWKHIQSNRVTYRRTTGANLDITSIGLRLVLDDTALTPPEPEYVDLGLSVKWATFNVGATSPEDYGDYFAWGETEPKETYSWATYKWCDGTQNTMTKYNAADGKTILEPADDAAQVHWGGDWRMPTEEEQQELIDRCSWERTKLNGVIGYKVTGPNGNSIFIPIAGAYNSFDNQLNSVGSIGWIYSSTKATGTRAYEIHIEEGIILQKDCSRCVGLTIRPVYDDRPPKRIGVFSVAADKQVSFSQGNLQYIQSTDTWQFAANQLEYMGHKHYHNGQLADTIEYFGWSGKDSKAPWGISLSTESSDYAGEFLDWGTNTIAGSAPNTWRTLSNDEWLYICQGRKNADQLLGLGKISSIFGLIILPDDWAAPEGITFTPNDNNPNANVYSLQQWTAMEEAGAIFIPPTGYFNHDIDNMRYVGTYGYARNNTLTANGLQIYTLFKPSEIQYSRSAQGNNGNLYYAFPQRLVHDTIVPKPEPEYVDLGLSVKWATFNVGATSPEDYGDYFAWGETETKDKYSWATYKWCDGTSTNMTKYNTEDGKTILEPADDAAQVHWGGKWRMPSKEEVDELTQQCNWVWTTHNNVNGYKVTGPNGNSIFLPAAGYKGAGPTYPAGEDGLYWTNTIEKGHYSYLIVLHNDAPPTQAGSSGTRCFGFAVRAVYDDRPPKRIGVFSVAADKQVSFSQGNLQYVQSTDEWRFAREQYDYIGKGNITNGQLGQIIDMFGWSADADPANKWGVTIAKEGFDGDFVDWGLNYIHGEAPGSWRTLSQDEWSYLLSCRQHATELWGVAQVAGVNGVIILPDRWSPTDDLPFVAGINENGYAAQQTLSVEQWQLMEELGAVFLPAAGGRDGASLAFSHIDSVGWYWLSTPTDPGKASCVRFECNLMVQRNGWRQAGLSVRLVHDTIVSKVEPEYVDLGLSVKWATFNVGATSPEDYGDYFAWGETQPKDEYSWKKYKWSNGTGNNITITKYNSTDSKHVLEPEDDAAHVLWGGKWRMPTVEEQTELREQCIWTWTSINGIWGHLVTGPNGKSIFLPAAGNITNTDLSYANVMGYQWSSSVKPGICAHRMHFSKNIIEDYDGGSRACGASIRPVYDDRVE